MFNASQLTVEHIGYLKQFMFKNRVQLSEGEVSKVFTVLIDATRYDIRFIKHNNNNTVLFRKEAKETETTKPLFKDNKIYLYDFALNRWIGFKKELFFKHLNAYLKGKLQVSIDSDSYALIDKGLSNTEKELLSMGKDITLDVAIYNKGTNKYMRKETINFVADFSFFLTSINPILKSNKTINLGDKLSLNNLNQNT